VNRENGVDLLMMDIETARQILGIADTATKEDIMQRYYILMRRQKDVKPGDKASQDGSNEMARVDEAYGLLMGFKKPEDEIPMKEHAIFKKFGLDEKKTRNFFHYYKFHIIGSIVLVLIVISFVHSVVTKVQPDLFVEVIGNFYVQDTDKLAQAIKKHIPGVKAPQIDIITITGQDGQTDYAGQMKALAVVAAGDTDVYIFDSERYKTFAKEGICQQLDAMLPKLKVDPKKASEYAIASVDSLGVKHIYGVDTASISFLKEPLIYGKQQIVGISIKAKHNASSLRFLHATLGLK
jgi:hypothetical protein